MNSGGRARALAEAPELGQRLIEEMTACYRAEPDTGAAAC
jgi:hypothetical protein